MNCLLCQSSQTHSFIVQKKPEKNYFICQNCDVIAMHPSQRLSAFEERQRYDLHREAAGEGHRAFLSPLLQSLNEILQTTQSATKPLTALDYGCGPSAILSQLMQQEGLQTSHYDPFYFPDTSVLERTYHVVTATEVWEHFYNPAQSISVMIHLLRPRGLLGIMTSAHKGEAAFHDWHYRRDPTHVTFYSERTMKWLAETFQLRILKAQSPYWIFQKSV
ncbi:MAG: class I SAM-dependent methyltransferase [Bdellovibrio sp.]